MALVTKLGWTIFDTFPGWNFTDRIMCVICRDHKELTENMPLNRNKPNKFLLRWLFLWQFITICSAACSHYTHLAFLEFKSEERGLLAEVVLWHIYSATLWTNEIVFHVIRNLNFAVKIRVRSYLHEWGRMSFECQRKRTHSVNCRSYSGSLRQGTVFLLTQQAFFVILIGFIASPSHMCYLTCESLWLYIFSSSLSLNQRTWNLLHFYVPLCNFS